MNSNSHIGDRYSIEQFNEIEKIKNLLLDKIPCEGTDIKEKITDIFEQLFKQEYSINEEENFLESLNNPFKRDNHFIKLNINNENNNSNFTIKGLNHRCRSVANHGFYEISGSIKNDIAYFSYNIEDFDNERHFVLKIKNNKKEEKSYTIFNDVCISHEYCPTSLNSMLPNHYDNISNVIQKNVFDAKGKLLYIKEKFPRIIRKNNVSFTNSNLGAKITTDIMMPHKFILRKVNAIDDSSKNIVYLLKLTLHPLEIGKFIINKRNKEYNENLDISSLCEYINEYISKQQHLKPDFNRLQRKDARKIDIKLFHGFRASDLYNYLHLLSKPYVLITKLNEEEYLNCLNNKALDSILNQKTFMSINSIEEKFKYVGGHMVPQSDNVYYEPISSSNIEPIKTYMKTYM